VVRTIVRKLAFVTIGRTMDRSSLSSLMGQPPRLSMEAKPEPKSSRAICTPNSASWAKNLVLAAVVPVSSLTSSASIWPGTCSSRRSSATAVGKSGPGRQLDLRLEVADHLPVSQRGGKLGVQSRRKLVGFERHCRRLSPQ
jgi:hypothetical protein